MSKMISMIFVGLLFSLSVAAQQPGAKGAPLPAFRMMLTNGRMFEAKDLSMDKPVVLVYFAPDCDHCIVLLDALFKKLDELKNTTLLLATFKPVDQLIPFERKYGTARYANMVVATEGYSFFLRNHYALQRTPFVAVYNREKKLVCSFRDKTPVPEIIACIKTIR